jgi:hypothetical protein
MNKNLSGFEPIIDVIPAGLYLNAHGVEQGKFMYQKNLACLISSSNVLWENILYLLLQVL